MNEQNNNVIMYRHPLGVIVRPKRAGYRFINFDDRSPEHKAMLAHLRATGYPCDQSRSQPRANDSRLNRSWLGRARRLLKLGREYEVAARDNFAREAALFCVIGLVGIAWPTIHIMKALAGTL
jgi:hypothetical protein